MDLMDFNERPVQNFKCNSPFTRSLPEYYLCVIYLTGIKQSPGHLLNGVSSCRYRLLVRVLGREFENECHRLTQLCQGIPRPPQKTTLYLELDRFTVNLCIQGTVYTNLLQMKAFTLIMFVYFILHVMTHHSAI